MIAGLDSIAPSQRVFINTFQTMGLQSLAYTEKLVRLNLQSAHALLEDIAHQAGALMNGKGQQPGAESIYAMVQPTSEKLTAYARQVYEIGTEANSVIAQTLHAHLQESQQAAQQWFDAAARSAPAASEPLFDAARNAMSLVRNSYDQAAQVGQKFAEHSAAGAGPSAAKANARTARKAA